MDRDDTDPGGPPPVMLDLEPLEDPNPAEIAEARRVDAFEEGRTEGNPNRQSSLGGVVTLIILFGILSVGCAIYNGNVAWLLASAILFVVVPVGIFVGIMGWRASAEKNKDINTKKGYK